MQNGMVLIQNLLHCAAILMEIITDIDKLHQTGGYKIARLYLCR
jgi:hypothetical protein